MEMDKAQFAEQLKNLVELGKKKKNVLEYQEINDFFKGITLNNEQMDLIFEYLEANGVDVLRVTEDDALLDNEDMHMEEDEVDLENIDLSVPEGVSIEDPVRMRKSNWQNGWKTAIRRRKNVWQKPIFVWWSASQNDMWDAACCSWI